MESILLIEQEKLYIKPITPVLFDIICEKSLDHLYTPGIPYKDQSTGYKLLREMVVLKKSPEEMQSKMNLFHPILREFIIKNWNAIKELEVSSII